VLVGIQTRIGCLTARICVLVGTGTAGTGDVIDVHGGRPGAITSIAGTRGMYDISCPDTSGCVALARVSDDQGTMLVPINAAGVPQRPISLALPIGVTLSRLSCISARTCELVGVDAFLEPNVLELGSWNGRALSLHAVVLPPAARGITTVGGVSCFGIVCTAVGYSQVPDGWHDGVVLRTVRGRPSPMRVLSGDSLNGVGCLSAALCYAGGFTIHRGVLVALDAGRPGATTGADADLMAVSCHAGGCFAVGAQAAPAGSLLPFEGVVLKLVSGSVDGASVISGSTGFSAVAALGPGSYAALGTTAIRGSATPIASLLTTG
jgi:hypothetical protein